MRSQLPSHRVLVRHAATGGLALAAFAAGCRPSDATTALPASAIDLATRPGQRRAVAQHVLLLSIDGLHASDLVRFVATHPSSALAQLSHRGTSFLEASTSRPSDSFPGMLAQVTGASPKTTGVYYDVSYDRLLSPPGSNCSVQGTVVAYDESIDIDTDRLDGGGGIDPTKLPRDGRAGCTPVYPHQFLRVNTIFEVAKAAGLRTAWSDKHPTYEILNGPSGHGLDEAFNPEVNSVGPNGGPTDNVANATAYDDLKVAAVLNWIAGLDHTGTTKVGTPALFGMNFQAVSVGQKTVGYIDAAGAPTAGLADALEHTDASIASMVHALERRNLIDNTLIIVSAKHGQSPINRADRRIISSDLISNTLDAIKPGLVAGDTEDDIALLWLTDQSLTTKAVATLQSQSSSLGIASILSGAPLAAMFGDPRTDSRTPDIIAQPFHGVIYTSLTSTKLAEHGGFTHDDTNVPILVAGPSIDHEINLMPVQTAQIAPTILTALGLDPAKLRGVQLEGTRALPLVWAAEHE
jgi:hypothetical protein